jgi:DNA-binding transcriptional LysR family regulator
MLEGISLDQLRTFIAAADEGSFSAAGRRLRRAQSVVSQTLANLESQLGLKLFDRTSRYPVLTDQGRALLADARVVAGGLDIFKARAKSLAGGLEPELSVAVDVMFPVDAITAAVAAFQEEFPATLLRFDVASSAVVEPVIDGRCAIGVVGSWSVAAPQLTCEALLEVRIATVVSPRHPLAAFREAIPLAVVAKHVHLLHIDAADISAAFGSYSRRSPRVWHLSHLGAKLAFLRAGLGFGGMPIHMIEEDLASGALVKITFEDPVPAVNVFKMSAIYRTDNPPGPAGRWFIERLKREDSQRENGEDHTTVDLEGSVVGVEQSPNRHSVANEKDRRP